MLTADQKFFHFLEGKKLQSSETNIIPLILKYFEFQLKGVTITLLEHHNEPDCYQCPGLSENEHKFKDVLVNLPEKRISPLKRLFKIDEFYLFPLANEQTIVRYLFIFSPSKAIENIFLEQLCAEAESIWRLTETLILNNSHYLAQQTENLVSRITHDMNAIASMSSPVAENEESLLDKIDYSQRLSQAVMLYLRDPVMQTARVSVKELMGGIIDDLRLSTKTTINLNFIDDFGYIHVDVELIELALSAVVENAITALSISGDNISIFVKRKDNKSILIAHDWLEISVQDNGAGIPTEFLTEVKKPFFTTWKDIGHVGLGLSQAEKIVSAHGGTLKLKSKTGDGTLTIINLPLENDKN